MYRFRLCSGAGSTVHSLAMPSVWTTSSRVKGGLPAWSFRSSDASFLGTAPFTGMGLLRLRRRMTKPA